MCASIDVEDGAAFQLVRAGVAVPLEVVDCLGGEGEASDEIVRQTVLAVLHRPFDLAAGPLVRVVLVRSDSVHCILCVAAHHIIWDGLSTEVFARELGSCYASVLDGTLSGQGQAAASFLDVARATGEGLSAVQAADLAWWKENLTPLPAPVSLPMRHAVARDSGQARTESRVLDRVLTARIGTASHAERATPFMTMFAAFATLLFRLTGQKDMMVAVPVSGRTDPDSERMIGLFVQTLPIRISVRPEERFTDLVRRVRAVTLDAMGHQAVPYPTLVREMVIERSEANDPLCQVAFQLRRHMGESLVLPGLLVEPYDVGAPASAYGFTMTIKDNGESMTALISYDPSHFDADTVRGLLRHYETLLSGVLEAPDGRLGDVGILDRDEERMVLDEWGGRATAGSVPRTTVHELVEQCARAHPDAVAVEEREARLTCGELSARAGRLALVLRAHGVSRGSVVGLLMGRSTDTVVAMLATLKAGAAYLPLDPDYPPARLSAMIRVAHPALLLAGVLPPEDVGGGVAALALETALAEASMLSGKIEDIHGEPDDPAYVIFTSGSTGEPKGVVVPHRGIIQLVSDHGYWDGDERDCVAHLSTVAFDAATFEVWGALCRGARVVVIDHDTVLSPALLALNLERHRVTTAFLTTSLFNLLVQEAPGLLGRLRLVLFGGEMADPAAVRLLLASGPPVRLLHVYGPTETTTFALWYEVHCVPEAAVTVPVGRPIAGATAYILDASGKLAPPGAVGELYVGGSGVALGYFGDEEMTSERFLPDPWTTVPGSRLYRTGDSAVWRGDGNLELRGRLDDQIKLRGFRIEPGEIVAALESMDRIRQAVVIAREDRPGDRRLVSYVVSADGQALDVSTLLASLAETLPSFMLPSACVQMPSLPMTPAGKLDVRALPAPDPVRHSEFPPEALSEAERWLAEVWQRVLGLEGIGVDDNFFELGGHSLTAVRLVADVERTMGIRIPMSTLFEAPTVRKLAGLLSMAGWTPDWSCLVPICTSGSLPPVFCVHGYGNEVLWLSGMSRELGADQPFYGLQPQGLDGRTEPLRLIEDMAARYVVEVRRVLPHGPYYLLGYSLGGVVALEMARQLEGGGEGVAFLGMIDSGFPGVYHPTQIPLLLRLKLHAMAMAGRDPADAVRYAGHRLRSLWRRVVAYLRPPPDAPVTDTSPGAVAARRVESANEAAWRSYVPKPWNGRLTYFATTDQGETIWESPRARWNALISGGMELVSVRGTHVSIVKGTDVVGLADAVRNSLRLARERCEAGSRGE
jgi:amino acid adenylation domain-containing protein